MEINELGFYLQANGCITEVTRIGKLSTDLENIVTYDNKEFFCNGRYYVFDGESGRDLIAHIPPALHYEILRVIEAYHQGGSFKNILDNCYKNHLEKKEN